MSLKNLPLKQIHKGLFYLLVLLLPNQLTKHFWPSFAFVSGIRIDYLAPTIYLTDILIIAIITTWALTTNHRFSILSTFFHIVRKRLVYLTSDSVRVILTFFLLSVYIYLNIIFAESSWIAILKWLKIAEMGLLALYIIKTKPNLRITYYLLVVTGFASIVLAWMQFIKGGSIGGILYWIGERTFTLGTPGIARQSFFGREYLRAYATFPHPNVLAGFLTATIPFILRGPLIRGSFLKLGLLAVWLATIFITGSQTALFISLLIIFIHLNKRNKKIVIALILTIAFLSFLFPNYQLPITNYLNSLSFTRRHNLNKAALEMIKESPIIGVGMNNFVIRLPEFYRLNEPAFFLQPVHNIYLLTLAEGGLVGLILLLWLLSKLYGVSISNFLPAGRHGKFQISKQIPISNIQYPISLATLLLIGFFDHYLFTLQQGLLLFTFIWSFTVIHHSSF